MSIRSPNTFRLFLFELCCGQTDGLDVERPTHSIDTVGMSNNNVLNGRITK